MLPDKRDLQAERDRLREALLAVEWGTEAMCGFCRAIDGCDPHAPDCIVALALSDKQP